MGRPGHHHPAHPGHCHRLLAQDPHPFDRLFHYLLSFDVRSPGLQGLYRKNRLAFSLDIVFAGINGSAEPYGYNRAKNVTGIFEHKLLRAVKEAIMALESKKDVPSPTPSLAYVLDPSPSLTKGRDNIDTYPWHPVAYKGSVIAWDYPDWQAIVQKLGSQVDYLIVANYRKLHTAGPDSPYADPKEAMAWTEKHSKAPVIGINSFNVEDGAMISIGVSPFEQGETAAAMAQEILTRNIRAGQIPMKQNSQYIVAIRESSL